MLLQKFAFYIFAVSIFLGPAFSTPAQSGTANRVLPPCPTRANVFDFDGDCKTDYLVIRQTEILGPRVWHIYRSTAGYGTFINPYVDTGRYAVPGDYDGDGLWDMALYLSRFIAGEPNFFYILRSQTNTVEILQWGIGGDSYQHTQDFDGDGKADPTVVRIVGNSYHWFINGSAEGFRSVQFGLAGLFTSSDSPVRGDYDGDGKADIAVYRHQQGTPANTFIVWRSSDNQVMFFQYGDAETDTVVPGDFDGDGKSDFAVYRRTTQTWYWHRSSDGTHRSLHFGAIYDFPVPGDYDGDGKTDAAVWRYGDQSYFYVNGSAAGFIAFPWGLETDDQPMSSLQNR